MFLVNLLLWYDYVIQCWTLQTESWKEWLRQRLGPSPNLSYILLTNDDVVPSTVSVHIPENALIYMENSIKPVHGQSKTQKLPWLSMQCKVGDTVHDYSDWMADLHVEAIPSLLSLLRLAAWVHNSYIPEEHCKVEVITRQGEEETYRFCGKRYMTKEVPPIRHRDTMPYDTPQKLDPKDPNECMWLFY